jgi:WD40 repeat protein
MSHGDGLDRAAISPDDGRMVTAGRASAARLWDAATGKLVAHLPTGDAVGDVNFSPDGRQFVTAGRDGKARVWDAATGVPRKTFTPAGMGWVYTACFSPDGQRLLTGNVTGTGRVWTGRTQPGRSDRNA